MEKKKRNKGKKALTAVGAVVAAGLTPGIVAASPIQGSNAEITAADVVAIDGSAYSFDELYAMQQPRLARSPGDPQVAARYGVRPSPRMYGVQRPPQPPRPNPQVMALDTTQLGLIAICADLIDADTRGIYITLDSDLTNELGMDDDQLKEFAAVIKDYYGVEVSYHRFKLIGQLNTLRLVSEYIYKLKTIWD